MCQALCVINAETSKTESLLHGTRDGVARGNGSIVERQHSHFPLCLGSLTCRMSTEVVPIT